MIVCIELLVLVFMVIYGGVFFSTPVDSSNTKADIIVILGGGTADRLAKGIDLFHQGLAQKVLVTGFPELKADAVPSYTQWRVKYLTAGGIPAKSLDLDGSARSSFEEAILIKNYLLANQLSKVIVVSDPPHMRRLSFIYESVFRSQIGLSFSFSASEPNWWDPDRWWSNKHSAQFVILEAIKCSYFFINSILNEKD